MLLLSRNDAYQYLSKFIAAEIASTIRNIPVEVKLGRREGLPSPCVHHALPTSTISAQSRASGWIPGREH
jgi:hypothetical protein